MPEKPSSAALSAGNSRLLSQSFRQFATLLGEIEDTARFAHGLQELIRGFPELESACLHFLVTAGTDFPPPPPRSLTLPLTGASGIQGQLSIPARRKELRRLRPEDLHLLSGLASVAGALLETSRRARESKHGILLVDHLLDQLPVGLLWRDVDGSILKVNTLAKRYLHLDRQLNSPYLKLLQSPLGNPGNRYHVEVGTSLYFARAVPLPGLEQETHGEITLLYDLSFERDRIIQHLATETYRCQLRGIPLSLLFLHSPSAENLQARLPYFEEAIESEDRAGTVDAHSLAIVFTGKTRRATLEWLRQRRALLLPENLKISLQPLDDSVENGAELVRRAQDGLEERDPFLKPSLLLWDRYAPVNNTLEMILKDHFGIFKARSPEEAEAILQQHHIDGVIMEQLENPPGEEPHWVRLRKNHPGIPFILTAPDAPAQPAATASGQPCFLQKPFQPGEVEQLLSRLFPGCFTVSG